MGLDNYWFVGSEDDPQEVIVPFDPPLHLIGGIFSGHGSGSFRGKVYAGVIEAVSGVSIYDDQDNATVKRIADALDDYTGNPYEQLEEWGLTQEEAEAHFKDLQRMFRAYADRGAWLHAWW